MSFENPGDFGGNSFTSSVNGQTTKDKSKSKSQTDRDGLGQDTVGSLNTTAPAKSFSPIGAGYSGPKGTQALNTAALQAGGMSPLAAGTTSAAHALGISPQVLGTAMSYETKGTFNPTIKGPITPQYGQHQGLIQFGEPQAKQFNASFDNHPLENQLGADGAVAQYLKERGVKPGMGLMNVYAAINAGNPYKTNASDANNGGAPGTVAQKVNTQMAAHMANASRMLGQTVAPAVHVSDVPDIPAPVNLSGLSAPAKPNSPTLRSAVSSYPAIAGYNPTPRAPSGSYAALKGYDSPITKAAYGDYQQPPGMSVPAQMSQAQSQYRQPPGSTAHQTAESYSQYRSPPNGGIGMTSEQIANSYAGYRQPPSQALKVAADQQNTYQQPPGYAPRKASGSYASIDNAPPLRSPSGSYAAIASAEPVPVANQNFVQGGLGATAYGKSNRTGPQVAASAANEALTGTPPVQVADRGLIGLKGKIADMQVAHPNGLLGLHPPGGLFGLKGKLAGNAKPLPGLTTAGKIASHLPVSGPFIKAITRLDNYVREANPPKSIYSAAQYDTNKDKSKITGWHSTRDDDLKNRLAMASLSLFGGGTSTPAPVSVNYSA